MPLKITKKALVIVIFSVIFVTGCLVLFAFARNWNKTDIEFRIHINKKVVQESTFGEPPTFAIWLEDPKNGSTQTIFVTNRAGLGDWEGKASVPVALPKWFSVNEKEKLTKNKSGNKIPEQIAISGATPKPGYFSTRVRVAPGSKWICFIEVNLAGDFNETFKEYDEINKTSDEYKTGQPAMLYRAEIESAIGNEGKPEIEGICTLDTIAMVYIRPPDGITTAKDIFDEITIKVIKPRPRIVEW